VRNPSSISTQPRRNKTSPRRERQPPPLLRLRCRRNKLRQPQHPSPIPLFTNHFIHTRPSQFLVLWRRALRHRHFHFNPILTPPQADLTSLPSRLRPKTLPARCQHRRLQLQRRFTCQSRRVPHASHHSTSRRGQPLVWVHHQVQLSGVGRHSFNRSPAIHRRLPGILGNSTNRPRRASRYAAPCRSCSTCRTGNTLPSCRIAYRQSVVPAPSRASRQTLPDRRPTSKPPLCPLRQALTQHRLEPSAPAAHLLL
jgi:hypothetical protein